MWVFYVRFLKRAWVSKEQVYYTPSKSQGDLLKISQIEIPPPPWGAY